MFRDFFLALLGERHTVEQPHPPKAYTRWTSAVVDNPLATLAFIVADSEYGSPVSELAVNGRILNLAPGSRPIRNTAMGETVLGVGDQMAPGIRGLRPTVSQL